MVPLTFPPEILDEIIQLSPRATQLTLCRTSHVFRSLTTRSLYKNVSLTTSTSLMQLCNTLRSNSAAAICVKCFSISYIPTQRPNTVYLASFYRNLREALLKLTNLRELSLLVHDPTFVQTLFSTAIQSLHFPLLWHFKTYLPLDPHLLSFVERHPTLNYLEVSHHENITSDGSFPQSYKCVTPARMFPVLRRLHHYVGNSVYLESLAPAYPLPLRSAFVIWNATQDCQGPISSLANAAFHTLNILTCRRRGWNRDLVGHITTHLPDIYALHIVNVLMIDAPLPQGYQEEIALYLSRCQRLQRLKITREVQWCPATQVQYDLDREFSIVTDWGATCPSLQVVILPHSYPHLEWHRVSENLWVPIDLSSHGTARGWIKDSIRRRKYSSTLNTLKQTETLLSASLLLSP